MTLFVALFEWPQSEGRRGWRLAIAVVYGTAISLAVTWVFQHVFLVRAAVTRHD